MFGLAELTPATTTPFLRAVADRRWGSFNINKIIYKNNIFNYIQLELKLHAAACYIFI